MKLIKTTRHYVDKKGEDKKITEFYIEVEGLNKPIQIMPKKYGDVSSTYDALNLVAVYVKDYRK